MSTRMKHRDLMVLALALAVGMSLYGTRGTAVGQDRSPEAAEPEPASLRTPDGSTGSEEGTAGQPAPPSEDMGPKEQVVPATGPVVPRSRPLGAGFRDVLTPRDQRNGLGLGLVVGDATGLSFKRWNGPDTAVQAAVAWDFGGNRDELHLNLDYLNHLPMDQTRQDGLVALYYGAGVRMKTHPRDDRFGLRVPLGISFLPARVPVDLFVEIAPTLDLVPRTDLDMGLELGARLYF